MDQKLAEIYGTNVPTESDLEKMAAAQMAEELTSDGSADLSGYSEEDLEMLAQQVLSGDEGEQYSDGDEATEKVAEADYLGRVMAHAYVQELRTIEKTAEEAAAAAPSSEAPAAPAAEAPKSRFQRMKEKGKAMGGAVAGHVGRHKKKYIGGALGALAVGAGLKAKQHFGKKSSALDDLTMMRVAEILEANGIDPEQAFSGAVKQSSAPNEVLANEVESRAWSVLNEMGFKQG